MTFLSSDVRICSCLKDDQEFQDTLNYFTMLKALQVTLWTVNFLVSLGFLNYDLKFEP